MRKKACLIAVVGALVALAACLFRLQGHVAAAPDNDPPRQAEEAALRQLARDFIEALSQGDAKAVAAFWTSQGEYSGGDGATLRGREAIEKAYQDFFAKNPRVGIKGAIDSIRFVSQDSAVAEGSARVTKGRAGMPVASRFSILYVRENGPWRMAILREWPDEGAALGDLDWLIGTWTAKTPNGEVRTAYTWDENKKFIHVRFTIKDKDNSVSGTQVLAKDPNSDGLRSWLFESDGGFGEATWSWDGKRWHIEARGTEADGAEITAENLLTPLDKDSFTWQSVNRQVGGEEQPDIPPVKVTRVK
jgi:uncharacterized protein (TIGR02246 family)